MIYRIAEPPPGGRGVVALYPSWSDDGGPDEQILQRRRDVAVLFTRNYSGEFLSRIGKQLRRYGSYIDIICGWEPEKLRMLMKPYRDDIEVLRLSAMNFNTFGLISETARDFERGVRRRCRDIFFSVSERSDGLKNVGLLVRLLSQISAPCSVIGYGRMTEKSLSGISGNDHLRFEWRGKASVERAEERRAFLADLAGSRCLLVTSTAEGYCRLIGEALLLGVPVLLYSRILCENWLHLDVSNCRLFTEESFNDCLQSVLATEWSFRPPVYEDGNEALRSFCEDYLGRRGFPRPQTWYPLGYGALNDRVISDGSYNGAD